MFRLKKISYLAVFSLFAGLLGIATFVYSFIYYDSYGGVIFSSIPSGVAVLLGLLAVIIIKTKKKRGYLYSIMAIFLGLPSILFVTGISMGQRVRLIAEKSNTARYNLRMLGKVMLEYTEDNNSYLPDANQWCDLLMEFDKSITRNNFKHPRIKKWDCNIAFNKNLSGLKLSEIPGDVVLLFEADGDWNLSGESDLFQKRHKEQKDYYFSYILLADGSIKTYRFGEEGYRAFDSNGTAYIKPLRWMP